MKKHFLLKQYALESDGRETRTAAFAKFFGRDRYYQKMGERLNNPALATRLELIDRRVKEASALCPFDSGYAFRKFLVVGESIEDVNERVRFVQEIVIQLRKARTEFQLYSFSAKDKFADALSGISRAIASFPPGRIRAYGAVVRCVLEVKQYILPLVCPAAVLPNPDIPVNTCSDLEIYISLNAIPVSVSGWDAQVRHARSI
jgi:hypothetical protein